MLKITVNEVRGKCPVHKTGDIIVINDPEIVVSETDALCTHALSTLLHYTTILEHDWCPVKLGLTTPEHPDHAYMQCVDPANRTRKVGLSYSNVADCKRGDEHGNPKDIGNRWCRVHRDEFGERTEEERSHSRRYRCA